MCCNDDSNEPINLDNYSDIDLNLNNLKLKFYPNDYFGTFKNISSIEYKDDDHQNSGLKSDIEKKKENNMEKQKKIEELKEKIKELNKTIEAMKKILNIDVSEEEYIGDLAKKIKAQSTI